MAAQHSQVYLNLHEGVICNHLYSLICGREFFNFINEFCITIFTFGARKLLMKLHTIAQNTMTCPL